MKTLNRKHSIFFLATLCFCNAAYSSLDTVSRSVFYQATKRAVFTQVNNAPSDQILYDKVTCFWKYVDVLGNPLPTGVTSASNLGIRQGNAYAHMSDKDLCVVGVDCTVTLKVDGTDSTRDFPKSFDLPQPGDCIEVITGNIVSN